MRSEEKHDSIQLLMRIEKYFVLLVLGLFMSNLTFSQNPDTVRVDETLKTELDILKKYFYEGNSWHIAQPSVERDVKGLIHFIEDKPVDTIIGNLNKSFNRSENYVIRLPENVSDSLSVPGYYANRFVVADVEKITVRLQKIYKKKKIIVPAEMISDLDERLNLIPEGKGLQLFTDSVYIMPESLQIPDVIPDSLLNSPEQFQALVRKDSIRNRYIEQKRLEYNDRVVSAYIDSVTADIRKREFETELNLQVKRLTDSVKVNNYQVLKLYNDSVINAVNDSIYTALRLLTIYADLIDSVQISVINSTNDSTFIKLKEGNERYTRVWLKNEQNDSLSVLVKNTGKRSMQVSIDDGVTISRFKPKHTKEFDIKTLKKDFAKFNNVGKAYEIETPWRIGGVGNIGITQTYLQNWKKGGQSSLASLLVLKGFAKYARADGKVKWENWAVIRNGWLRPGGKDSEIQKNDDRLEFTSRYSLSAFNKWYYSAELNFETQIFHGYKYPKDEHPDPISAFMAPSKTFLKLGFEYKPNKEFSLLLSPVTVKNVFVRDTVLIDQTKFGVDPDRRSMWDPGLNADLRYKTKITEDITYETRYKMFIDYRQPFSKFDINWENLFVMKLNDYIRLLFMVHFIYDDDVLFPVYDANDVKIGEEPKLQIKELMTIGFAYSINRKVMRVKRIR